MPQKLYLVTQLGDDLVKSNAKRFIEEKTTIRDVAKKLGVSKSCLHYRLTKILPKVDAILSAKVSVIIEKNKQERHIKGGKTTKERYTGVSTKKRIKK